jgi:hypothetical protein
MPYHPHPDPPPSRGKEFFLLAQAFQLIGRAVHAIMRRPWAALSSRSQVVLGNDLFLPSSAWLLVGRAAGPAAWCAVRTLHNFFALSPFPLFPLFLQIHHRHAGVGIGM